MSAHELERLREDDHELDAWLAAMRQASEAERAACARYLADATLPCGLSVTEKAGKLLAMLAPARVRRQAASSREV
jgi:hypothetical protein